MSTSEARLLLVKELGLEPGPELSALQAEILQHSLALQIEPGDRDRSRPG